MAKASLENVYVLGPHGGQACCQSVVDGGGGEEDFQQPRGWRAGGTTLRSGRS